MRGGPGWIARPGVLVALLLFLAGCAGIADPSPALPTFPGPSAAAATTAEGPQDVGVVPDDCSRMLNTGDLVAVMGLPLDSVTVRTTIGVPAPAVGRVERLDCAYNGAPAGPVRGRTLLMINSAGYTTPEAARAQWRINADAEKGAHRDVPLGSASGVLVDRAGEAVLTVLFGTVSTTLTLPDRPLPGGRSRDDLLVDLALRVLPTVAAAGHPPAAPVPAPAPARAGAAAS